jgi:hypothetical protein
MVTVGQHSGDSGVGIALDALRSGITEAGDSPRRNILAKKPLFLGSGSA